eukprot:c11829_g1_i1.p1 GENE.c11829_g1_i1~~c11829_g1_i1.p1  ORF type:complete len:1069 (-),score=212.46 c11829_g1_i1:48-3254(-)
MKFGKRLTAHRKSKPEWKFVDYELLKYKICSSVKDFGPSTDAQFLDSLRQEVRLVNEKYLKIREDLRQRFEMVRKNPSSKTLTDLMHDLCGVREYVGWNYMAIMKIVKKYNKNVRDLPGHKELDPLHALMEQTFYRSCEIARMIAQCEMMLCRENPNTVTRDNLLCSICLGVLCDPILLSCSHRFCWSCLEIASEPSHTCPVCRKEDPISINPENFEVDESLSEMVKMLRANSLDASPSILSPQPVLQPAAHTHCDDSESESDDDVDPPLTNTSAAAPSSLGFLHELFDNAQNTQDYHTLSSQNSTQNSTQNNTQSNTQHQTHVHSNNSEHNNCDLTDLMKQSRTSSGVCSSISFGATDPPIVEVLSGDAIIALVSPFGEQGGWVDQPSSFYDASHGVVTTRLSRHCNCHPVALFTQIRKPEALSPLHHLGPHTLLPCVAPKGPLSLAAIDDLPNFDSQLSESFACTVAGIHMSVVQTRLLNTSSLCCLVVFEYRCELKLNSGPWIAVAALVEQRPDDPNSSKLVVVSQIDTSIFCIPDHTQHTATIMDRVIQNAVISSTTSQINNAPVFYPQFSYPACPPMSRPHPSQLSHNFVAPTPATVPPPTLTLSFGDPQSTNKRSLPLSYISAASPPEKKLRTLEAAEIEKTLQSLNCTVPPPSHIPAPQNNHLPIFPSNTSIASESDHDVVVTGTTSSNSATDFTTNEASGQKFDRFGRIVWTEKLHDVFLMAIERLGVYSSRPKVIHQLMNVIGVTVDHIKSHLQMYRASIKVVIKKRCADNVSVRIVRRMTNTDLTAFLRSYASCSDDEISRLIESLVLSCQSPPPTTAAPSQLFAPTTTQPQVQMNMSQPPFSFGLCTVDKQPTKMQGPQSTTLHSTTPTVVATHTLPHTVSEPSVPTTTHQNNQHSHDSVRSCTCPNETSRLVEMQLQMQKQLHLLTTALGSVVGALSSAGLMRDGIMPSALASSAAPPALLAPPPAPALAPPPAPPPPAPLAPPPAVTSLPLLFAPSQRNAEETRHIDIQQLQLQQQLHQLQQAQLQLQQQLLQKQQQQVIFQSSLESLVASESSL